MAAIAVMPNLRVILTGEQKENDECKTNGPQKDNENRIL